jgi:hypothetical protein
MRPPNHSIWQAFAVLTVLLLLRENMQGLAQQPSDAVPSKSKQRSDVVVDFKDLPKEERLRYKRLIADAVADTVNKLWQDFKITDPVEVAFFADMDKCIRTKSNETSLWICLVKPGKEKKRVRCLELRGDDKVVFRYTCITATVGEPFAIVNEIDVNGNGGHDISIREKFLFYDEKAGWCPAPESFYNRQKKVSVPVVDQGHLRTEQKDNRSPRKAEGN